MTDKQRFVLRNPVELLEWDEDKTHVRLNFKPDGGWFTDFVAMRPGDFEDLFVEVAEQTTKDPLVELMDAVVAVLEGKEN